MASWRSHSGGADNPGTFDSHPTPHPKVTCTLPSYLILLPPSSHLHHVPRIVSSSLPYPPPLCLWCCPPMRAATDLRWKGASGDGVSRAFAKPSIGGTLSAKGRFTPLSLGYVHPQSSMNCHMARSASHLIRRLSPCGAYGGLLCAEGRDHVSLCTDGVNHVLCVEMERVRSSLYAKAEVQGVLCVQYMSACVQMQQTRKLKAALARLSRSILLRCIAALRKASTSQPPHNSTSLCHHPTTPPHHHFGLPQHHLTTSAP